MVVLWKVSSILFYLTLTKFGLISCVLYVESGTSLSLDPGMTGTPEDILWTFNGNKLAERDLSDFQEYGQFMKRTQIDFTTGRLIVHRMTRDDSGLYRVMIQINEKLQYYEVDVEVIDGVSEPQVTCEVNSSSRSRHLRCSVTDGINVMYTWTGPNELQSSQTLEIDKDEPSESLYICTVKNPVSQKHKSIILKDCSTGSDGLNLPLIIIPLVIFSVIFIVGASALLYFRWRRNKEGTRLLYSTLKQNEDENQRSRNDHDGDQSRVQRVQEDEGTLNNEGAVTRTQDSDGNTDENLSEQIKDVQSESEQIHESDQNRVQRVHEDEGTLNNEGVNMINQETKSKTDENISEQKKDDIQSESEQVHESKNSKEVKEEELKMSSDRRESVDTNEQTDCINKDSQSENCSDEHSEQQEVNDRNFQDQFEHLHHSANESNQSINHDEDEDEDEDGEQIMSEHIETSKEEEERNTDEGAEENIPEKSEDASSTSSDSEEQMPSVTDRIRIIENRC